MNRRPCAEAAAKGEAADAEVSSRAARGAARRAQPGPGVATMTTRDLGGGGGGGGSVRGLLGVKGGGRKGAAGRKGGKGGRSEGGGGGEGDGVAAEEGAFAATGGVGRESGDDMSGDHGSGDGGDDGSGGVAVGSVRVDSYDTPALLRLNGEMADPRVRALLPDVMTLLFVRGQSATFDASAARRWAQVCHG